jgi:hypothetical protein
MSAKSYTPAQEIRLLIFFLGFFGGISTPEWREIKIINWSKVYLKLRLGLFWKRDSERLK